MFSPAKNISICTAPSVQIQPAMHGVSSWRSYIALDFCA